MGMLMDAVWQLIRTGLVIIQYIIFAIVAPVYGVVFIVVGALNLLLVLVRGEGFSNIDKLFTPLEWLIHQLMVAVGMSDDFRAAPYL